MEISSYILCKVRHCLTGTGKNLAGVAVCALAVCLAGCSKNTAPEQAVFGGPAKVTLVVDGGSGSATKISANVDEANTVKSVKIFAFKHAPVEAQNYELVGYGYWDGISGQGPHYCTMQLSASGNIDFYVIAKDESAPRAAGRKSLDVTSRRTDIEDVRSQGQREIDGASRNQGNGHGLADRTAAAEHDGRDDARPGGRHNDPEDRLDMRRAESQGSAL